MNKQPSEKHPNQFLSIFDLVAREYPIPEPDSPRARIIDAARELFAEQGFDGTSTRQIAEKSNVNLAMVHYYFGSKEKLYLNIIAMQFYSAVQQTFGAVEGDLPMEELIISLPRRIVTTLRKKPVWVQLLRREIADGGKYLHKIIDQFRPAGLAGLKSYINTACQSAVQSGTLKNLPSETILRFLITISHGTLFIDPLFQIIFNEEDGNDETWEKRFLVYERILKYGLLTRVENEKH